MRELAQWSYTLGENIGDDAAKHRHFVQGAIDRGHAELMVSRLEEAWDTILSKVAAYTVSSGCGCGNVECVCEGDRLYQGDDIEQYDGLFEDDAFEVTLSFPDNTHPDLGKKIASLMKRYLVLQGRAEWERLTHQDENDCASDLLSAQTLQRLKIAITMRTTTSKIRHYGYR